MKRAYVIFSIFIAFFLNANAESLSNIYISVYQPEREEISSEAAKHIVNKMKSLITANGISDEDEDNRFVITVKALIKSKDIVPSTPHRVFEKIDFTFIIGDVVENKVFESLTIPTVGIGVNENKAFISAINRININNRDFASFLSNAKRKIINYYSERCVQIIQQAKQSAADKDFDEAIYLLEQVPAVCACSQECQDLAMKFYEQKSNSLAVKLITEARSVWASSPTEEGASQAADILKEIPAGTHSQNDIDNLISDIETKLKEDQKQEWAFKIKQYQDNIAKEKREYAFRSYQQKADNDYRSRQQASDNAARRQYIEACRQVGLEYAKKQPRTLVCRKNVYYW